MDQERGHRDLRQKRREIDALGRSVVGSETRWGGTLENVVCALPNKLTCSPTPAVSRARAFSPLIGVSFLAPGQHPVSGA